MRNVNNTYLNQARVILNDKKINVSNKRLRRLAYLDVHQLNYKLFSLYNIYKKIITKDAANNQIVVLFIALAILFTLAYLLLV
jgi:hypothetical protein|tara:strand:- start:424 stop:672 length:249 start_codon:yes stop_codon:yes gene_type:complete